MPGSKRRALKKLLSPPSSSAPIDSASAGSSSPPDDLSLAEQSSFSALGSSPGSAASIQASLSLPRQAPSPSPSPLGRPIGESSSLSQEAAVDEMQSREDKSASGAQALESAVESLSLHGDSDAPSVPPPVAASPPAAGTGTGGMYGKSLTAESVMFGNGGGEGKKKKKSSKQRFAERQARKQQTLFDTAPPLDPAWNQQLEKERQEEIQVIRDACNTIGCEVYEIAPDGHCMFNAIGDQLHNIGLVPGEYVSDPRFMRKAAAEYMLAHPDDFMPFLPSIGGEDSAGATDDGMMTEEGFKKYCALVADTGEWGGEPEIQALSRAFKVPIHVIQRGPPTVVSHGGADDNFGGATTAEQSAKAGTRVVRISYHKRMYGLGEHYNSLRRAI